MKIAIGNDHVAVEMKKEIKAYLEEKGIEVLLCAGGLSEAMAQAAQTGGSVEVHHFADTESLKDAVTDFLQQGDTVLVKASHGMHFEKIVEELTK